MSDFGNDPMASMCRVWYSDLRAQSSVNLSISLDIGSFENSGWCLVLLVSLQPSLYFICKVLTVSLASW